MREKADTIQRGLDESRKESQRALDESQRAYHASITTMMELRAPIYQLHSGHQASPKYRERRNAVVHGGSVLMDLSILLHLCRNTDRTAAFTKWAVGFEDIYGIPFHYVKTLSESSRMVTLLNIHADVLLNVYSSYDQSEYIKDKCTVIIRH
ncbi:uncharacterized protein MCYG_00083 [Microsporum canis CBS 113480]|uniref:Uncharacterized protein n=1 Tax=Arthroderma otae (strain ATCC MYA-4605 / CBS 113480) TaxID=554155 RepID=C5FBL1_ARTOC|nr:uncharacterized protein MCYG_00083 [Microsporum canis CBS 113480]EEQ27195.1 predicted protein [Microsporum canis CBS 113480]